MNATISGSSSHAQHRSNAFGQREDHHHDQVKAEVEQCQEDNRERDDQSRELDLAHEVLAIDNATHRATGGFREEGEKDDRAEQLCSVELVGRALQPVDLRDLREEYVQHPKQQKRPHELPDVTQHRAEETKLELVAGNVVREVPETRPVVGQRARTADGLTQGRGVTRLAIELGGGDCRAHRVEATTAKGARPPDATNRRPTVEAYRVRARTRHRP